MGRIKQNRTLSDTACEKPTQRTFNKEQVDYITRHEQKMIDRLTAPSYTAFEHADTMKEEFTNFQASAL